MQTEFSERQLADPSLAAAESAIRRCVHCGFCTATCPTYVLLRDELDGPRGRIYLMKDMLENERVPSKKVVAHLDRCLSCLACTSTCPSGVDYRHLLDHSRAYVEARFRRPMVERAIRYALAAVLPHPARFRLAIRLARPVRHLRTALARWRALKPLAAMLDLVPDRLPPASPVTSTGTQRAGPRVALLQGCVESVLRPTIREATVRLLERTGHAVVFVRGEGCCGALAQHLGREADSLSAVRRNVDAWTYEIEARGLEAIVVTASGCGSVIKQYGHMLRDDAAYAAKAQRVASLAKDVTELLAARHLPRRPSLGISVAWQSPCSLQHGQRITDTPPRLLERVGFTVRTPAEAHLCCGSAGTYHLLQPEIAGRLGERKARYLERLTTDVIATGNIGCAVQLATRASVPVVHAAELIDWATGGPAPPELSHIHPSNIGEFAVTHAVAVT